MDKDGSFQRVKTSTAVEPNEKMREQGKLDSSNLSINWIKGEAEKLNLKSDSTDWLTMASSFHWADFDRAVMEFRRVLRKGGFFTALWNTRIINQNPILVEIEAVLKQIAPTLERISSGSSGITDTLTEQLEAVPFFANVTYIEDTHSIIMDKDRYIGVWKSVNDIQAQLGEHKFNQFLDQISLIIKDAPNIETTYRTRSWSAQKVN